METDFPEAIVPQFQKFSEYLVNKIERNLQNFDLTSFLINGQYNRLTNPYIGNNSYLIIFSIYICPGFEIFLQNGNLRILIRKNV